MYSTTVSSYHVTLSSTVTNLCLATLESCYPYTSGDTTKTDTYQKTCQLELINYLLCNRTE
jgi:hypothetical protein